MAAIGERAAKRNNTLDMGKTARQDTLEKEK
jgi:hypothetical protein